MLDLLLLVETEAANRVNPGDDVASGKRLLLRVRGMMFPNIVVKVWVIKHESFIALFRICCLYKVYLEFALW